MDWRARLGAPLVEGESNPATTDVRPGGVAHNVWRALCHFRLDAQLVSLPGPDKRLYMALEHADGTLAHGIACLDAYEQLDAAFAAQHMDRLTSADVLVVDGNCTHDLFAALPAHACMALVAVSPAKMQRMVSALAHAAWLFCNQAEYRQLQSLQVGLTDQLNIVETRGGDGLILHSRGKSVQFEAPKLEMPDLDETGLGDAMAACILAHVTYEHSRNEPEAAVANGLKQFPALLSDLSTQPNSKAKSSI